VKCLTPLQYYKLIYPTCNHTQQLQTFPSVNVNRSGVTYNFSYLCKLLHPKPFGQILAVSLVQDFRLSLEFNIHIYSEMKVSGVFRLHNVTVVGFYYLFNCYIFRSYGHLEAEIYLLDLTLLITDLLVLEY
jgi:hypothetical protein